MSDVNIACRVSFRFSLDVTGDATHYILYIPYITVN